MIIGIIGGGQLGQMLAISALKSGHKVICLDPTVNCPCAIVANEHIVAEYNDVLALEELCEKSDVVTYEFENVPYEVIKDLEEKYNIPQGYRPLYYSQNRLVEKRAAMKAGLKTAPFLKVDSKEDLSEAINEIGLPAILKTCSGGYDGKGQIRLSVDSDLSEAYELSENTECILEGLVNFDSEISVIVVRNKKGLVKTFPVPENIHINNILHMSILPNNESDFVINKASKLAIDLMEKLDLVGILAIEMFVDNKDIYFNEMAPRPHNSGHYTIEGCESSQFDLAIQSILNQELTSTKLIQPTIMVNLLGQHMDKIDEFNENDAFIHLYGKKEAKRNRKMGHITFINKTKEEVEEILKKYWEFR